MYGMKDRKTYRGKDFYSYGSRWFYWITFEISDGKYYGYYPLAELKNFPECVVTESVLLSRLKRLKVGSALFTSVWDCITIPLIVQQNYVPDDMSIDTHRLMMLWPVTKTAATVDN